MQTQPIDQATRDEIFTALDQNFFVEAGAGTGKTTVLVARIVAILRSGYATVDQIAVITFTKLAAAELASRVREQLEAALSEAGDDEEARRLEEALAGLSRARIETIHAFAAGLLRERPVEAGLDPGFEELDDLSASLAFDEAYRAWIGRLLQGRPPAVWRALNRGLDLKQIREIVEHVHEHRDLFPLAPEPVPSPDIGGFLQRLDADVDELTALLADCHDLSDRGAKQIRVLQEFRDACRALNDDSDSLERLLLDAPAIGKKGAKKNWARVESHERQQEIALGLRDALAEVQEALKTEAIAGLLPLAVSFVNDYTRQRRAAGRAEFGDLLIWLRDLLRDNLEVRHYFRERFRCILVDEFQDTDPLQVEIVLYLCGDGPPGADWRDLRPAPGRLFVVGDPKQSIYRFRRADISIYEWVKQQVLPDSFRTIVQNFRSLDGVIHWVNRAFTQIIAQQDEIQAEYVALEPWVSTPLELRTRASVVVVHGDQEKASAEEVRRQEAATLAAILWQAAHPESPERWQVRDPGDGTVRDARWRDIAILLPNRTGMDFYEEALGAAGIPYRHEGGRAFFQRQEVRELINCLRAVDDPGDRLSLVAALRSGAFGCSDEEIFLAMSAIREPLDYRRHAEQLQEHVAVVDGLETLRALHEERRRLTLPELVRRVIDETRLVEYALTLPQGDQAAANLLKVVEQARAFSAARGGGLRAFVRWLDTSSESSSQEPDAAVAEPGDDVVRLLTIHAAKGLEFPIVALANLNGRSQDRTRAIPDRERRRLHLRVGTQRGHGYYETPGFAEAAATEQLHSEAERARLLYVAATRARDHLIVPAIPVPEKAQGMLAKLVAHLPALDPDRVGTDVDDCHLLAAELLPAPEWTNREAPKASTADAVEQALADRQRWATTRDRLRAERGAGLRVAIASSTEEWERPADPDEGVSGFGRSRDDAKAIGTALHRTMELLDLRHGHRLEALARDQAIENGVPHAADEVVRLAQACFQSDAVARARRADYHAREVSYTLALEDGGFVDGTMDLLFREPEGLVIVDYKSDRVVGEAIEARVDRYRDQAAVYAYAAQQITGLPVQAVILVFAYPGTLAEGTGTAVEVSIPADAALLARGAELARTGGVWADAAG